MNLSSIGSLAVFLVVSFLAASSGAVFKPGGWYAGLRKPSWTPPNWMFPVVWTILFTLMAVSAWLVWREAGTEAWPALALYGVHLVVNAGWSFLFFGRHRLDWAMIDVAVLWTMIALLIVVFGEVSVLAGALLIPYLLWVSIAAALNFRLLRMNGPRGTAA